MSIHGRKSGVSHRPARSRKWANPRCLTEAQCRELMKQAEGDQNLFDVITLALNTGLRQGEMKRLCWSDVDLDQCTIKIVDRKSAGLRMIPITESTKALLASRMERLSLNSEFVFGASTIRAVAVRLGAILHGIGVERGGIHLLRSTWAHRLGAAGMSPIVLCTLAG